MSEIKTQIIKVNIKKLFLDAKNPRFPISFETKSQDEIWECMSRAFRLEELALSMVENGYFEIEPMAVIPKKEISTQKEYDTYKVSDNEFIVVDGNRRLSAIRGLIDKKFPDIKITEDLQKQFEDGVPVLFYAKRDDILSFLGVHHLAGVRSWDIYDRARYIVHLKREKGKTLSQIQDMIGNDTNLPIKLYVSYRLIEILKEHDDNFDDKSAKDNFSFLTLALSKPEIRAYIGLQAWQKLSDSEVENPIASENREKLSNLFRYIFDYNSDTKRIIRESRDIDTLSTIFSSDEGINRLLEHKDIDEAYEISIDETWPLKNIMNSLSLLYFYSSGGNKKII